MTIINDPQNNISITNDSVMNNNPTWNDMTVSWDDAQSPWDNPYMPITNDSPNNLTIINDPQN